MTTLTFQSVIALVTSLGALVSIYINLSEKIARGEERYTNLEKAHEELKTWVSHLDEKMEHYQKEVTQALITNSNSIDNLTKAISKLEKKLDM